MHHARAMVRCPADPSARLIQSRGRADNDWQLRLGPGTQVRMVTAVLVRQRL